MKILSTTLLSVLSTFVVVNSQQMKAPKAKKIEHNHTALGDLRIDNYYWLRERENPEVIEYLTAENKYTAVMMKDTEEFQQKLFWEIRSKIKEDDESVPYNYNGYWYISRYEKDYEYPIHSRKKGSL